MFIIVNKKTWKEFRDAGLLWWVNNLLHMFGWAIVFDFDTQGEIISVYPARVKFRGFEEKDVTLGYQKVSKYLMDSAAELYEETML